MLPKDGRPAPEQQQQQQPGEEEPAGPREAVVVLDADSCPMAEQVLLQLILKRSGSVRAVVRDAAAAKAAFASYVQPETDLRRALRGAAVAVVCGPLSQELLSAADAMRLQHLVLLSTVGAPRPPGLLLPFSAAAAEAAVLGDASREERLKAAAATSGLRHTIVQVGALTDSPGGASQLQLGAGGRPSGAISREDASRVLAEAAAWQGGASLVLQAAAVGPGAPPDDWPAVLAPLAAAAAVP